MNPGCFGAGLFSAGSFWPGSFFACGSFSVNFRGLVGPGPFRPKSIETIMV